MFLSDRIISWYVAMNVLFHRQTEIGLQETEGGIQTQVYSSPMSPILRMTICEPIWIAKSTTSQMPVPVGH
jgi:hypothetical protein